MGVDRLLEPSPGPLPQAGEDPGGGKPCPREFFTLPASFNNARPRPRRNPRTGRPLNPAENHTNTRTVTNNASGRTFQARP
ncbi:MAG: hypothetical protein KGY48_11775, partial [Wenzhouxiangellaceae bacterium]|nr:hypothetical protein [Wenzhouxiangellaceae bacterium]